MIFVVPLQSENHKGPQKNLLWSNQQTTMLHCIMGIREYYGLNVRLLITDLPLQTASLYAFNWKPKPTLQYFYAESRLNNCVTLKGSLIMTTPERIITKLLFSTVKPLNRFPLLFLLRDLLFGYTLIDFIRPVSRSQIFSSRGGGD